jgi:hypothetical protein
VNELQDSFIRAIRDLQAMGYAAALIGGVAVSIRAKARFTRDIDIAVAVAGDPEAEALIRHLLGSGYSVLAMIEQEDTGRFATARMVVPGEDAAEIVVDMLFASSGIEPEIVAEATDLEVWPGVMGKVARVGHLIALKMLSRDMRRRPMDQVDLVELIKIADAAELALAFDAVELIERRGFARGKQLGEELRQFLAFLAE